MVSFKHDTKQIPPNASFHDVEAWSRGEHDFLLLGIVVHLYFLTRAKRLLTRTSQVQNQS